MIQKKTIVLNATPPLIFVGLNENTDHICLEINKSALTKNLPCDTTQIFGNKNLLTIWPSHEWPLPRNDNEM